MFDEFFFPDPSDDDIPADIGDIISQMKLLYMIGGEDTMRIALSEAGVAAADVEQMIQALRESIGKES